MSIWQYKGRSFSVGELRHLDTDFQTSYRQVVQMYGDRTFVVSYEAGMRVQKTFSEFDRDVQAVAHRLREISDGVEVFITKSGNSYIHLVHIFAILLSNKVLFPLNPSETWEFVERQIHTIQKRVFVFVEAGDSVVRPNVSTFFEIVSNFGGHHGAEAMHLSSVSETSQKDLNSDFIYVMTSGSTGHSKIVRQRQSGVLSNISGLIDHHRLYDGATIGTCLPIFHVNALEFSVMCSFFSGNKLVLWRELSITSLAEQIVADGVQIYSATPELLRVVFHRANRSTRWTGLRYFVSAASALSTDVVGEGLKRTGVPIIQGYGLSEAVNFSTTLPVDLPSEAYRKLMIEVPYPSIGTEIWGNEVSIRNEQGDELGENEVGEICVRGFNVMSGYVGHKSPDQFMRTGDVGYFKSFEGKKFFFISGRIKDVAKRYGETVPLRDIDDFLLATGIDGFDCIAVAFPNCNTGEEIGLVCRTAGVSGDWRCLLEKRIELTPVYKRPKAILIENVRPIRTASGKPLRWKFVDDFGDLATEQIGIRMRWLNG
ncbi:MAG: acyl--CoA ligase [Bdellovibrionaceae bacterium]|nr:acyl--CoA ligase [Pseudobdellovibrionaceae bacterium]